VRSHREKADAEEWAYVWLGGAYPVSGLILTPAAVGGFPVDFRTQYSSDGKVWADIRSYSDYTAPGGKPHSLAFGKPITASYFRILATKLSKDKEGDYCFALSELTTAVESTR
jgi:hypothetical protein